LPLGLFCIIGTNCLDRQMPDENMSSKKAHRRMDLLH
jgi:hypothetical protein